MRILVTGGAGFIGSNYVRQLLTGAYPAMADADVVVLDKVTYAGNEENLAPVASNPRLRFIRGDICDAALVTELMTDVDQVVHFAAESHVDRSIIGSANFVLTNVLGTHTLLQAALGAGVEKFVHVSTDEVYGSIDGGSWQEDHLLEPNSPYSAPKASSDLMARAFHHTHGLPVCVTRIRCRPHGDGALVCRGQIMAGAAEEPCHSGEGLSRVGVPTSTSRGRPDERSKA